MKEQDMKGVWAIDDDVQVIDKKQKPKKKKK